MNIEGRDHSLQDWYGRFQALVGERVAHELTLGEQQRALDEWKSLKKRVEEDNETIPLAFPWTQPGVWEGNVL